jgi:predicted nucleic acid-binding protein
LERLKTGLVVLSVIPYGEPYCGASKNNQRVKALAERSETVRDIPVAGLTSTARQAFGMIRLALEKQGRITGNNNWKQRCMDRCPRHGHECHPGGKQ